LKLSYYRNYCIDCNQILHRNKNHQALALRGWSNYAPNKWKMADSRHLEKLQNLYQDISAMY